VEGIRFCHFEDGDVVRHSLVQRIVRAYDSFGRNQPSLPLSMAETPTLEKPRAKNGGVPLVKPQ